jgi:ubiquinone/menaquinone biosynthesis C-methylase UbiE
VLFDVQVSTLVLCSVDNPSQVLQEIARVLKPGGRYVFLEHVRAESASGARAKGALLAMAQDAADPLQALLAAGQRAETNHNQFLLVALDCYWLLSNAP